MDGLPQIPREQSAAAVAASAGAPPPPTEVKIRTMKSDLATLAASGGLPRFENVKVGGLALEKSENEKVQAANAKQKNHAAAVALITIVALIMLAILGYLGYKIFTTGSL